MSLRVTGGEVCYLLSTPLSLAEVGSVGFGVYDLEQVG